MATGFVATFRNGPLAEPEADRHFIGRSEPLSSLYFIPFSDAIGWALVGFTGMEPDPPWPNQIRYDLVDVDSEADLNGIHGALATYALGSE
jgi:hypothetical protein